MARHHERSQHELDNEDHSKPPSHKVHNRTGRERPIFGGPSGGPTEDDKCSIHNRPKCPECPPK